MMPSASAANASRVEHGRTSRFDPRGPRQVSAPRSPGFGDLATEFRRSRYPDPPRPLPDPFRSHRSPTNASTLRSLPEQRPGIDRVMTASMREVERIVTRLANAAGAMPNNPVLGELAGGRGRSSVLRALRRLVAAEVLAVEKQGSQRRVTVMATGKSTGWGEARPGHSPYLHRRPGDPITAPRPKSRRPESRPLAASHAPDPEPEPAPPAANAGNIAPASQARQILCPQHVSCRPLAPVTCQYPMWPDGERPGPNPLFCDGAALPGHSFCLDHQSDCFRKRQALRAARLPERKRFDAAA